jgi:hypothetical protein
MSSIAIRGFPSTIIPARETAAPCTNIATRPPARHATATLEPFPASAKNRIPHRPVPARRGFVHPRLSYASGARNSSGFRTVAEAWLNGEIAPRATNSLLTIEPSCSTQSRRSWPTRPSKPQVREYGGRVLFPSFGSSHVRPRRWSRRIAYYKRVALIEGTNIVRHELGLPRRMFVPPRAVFRDGRRLSLFRQPGLAQRLGQHRQARLIGG